MSKAEAIRKVNEFSSRKGRGRFVQIDRAKLAAGLIERINDPNRVAQKYTPLCGPASLVRAIAKDNPLAYATAAIDLYTKGKARIGKFKIEPGKELLRDPPEGSTNAADWVMLASIRDSANWVLSTSGWFSGSVAGVTGPSTLVQWLRDTGYTKVVQKTHLVTKERFTLLNELEEAKRLYNKGHWVFMLVDGDVLDKETQDDVVSLYPDHWIVLDSVIKDGYADLNAPISFKAYSLGYDKKKRPKGQISIPETATKALPKWQFLHKFYGFVAARR